MKITGLKIFILTMLGLALLCSQASAELTAKANHDHINIDFFYHGSTVSVSGISDPGTDLIIKITSPEEHQTMKEKGKVAGLLWMNVNTLKIENVPNLYSIHSTKKLEDILSSEEMEKHVIGYQALEKHVGMSPVADDKDKAKWFAEFVKFKENSKLYAASSGKIELTEKDGKEKYYILTPWPYQALPGDYTVTVYAVKNKKVVETAEAKVVVEQVGAVKSLAGMAKNNASLYGILSILAALGAGFGVGMVFGKGGGAH